MVLWILIAVVLAGLLAVALVPIRLAAQGAFTQARVDARATASWGLGLLTFELTPAQGGRLRLVGLPVYRVRLSDSENQEEEPSKPPPRTRRRRFRPTLRFLARVTRRVVRSLHLRGTLRGRVGAGNPADTATLFGALVVVRRWLPLIDTQDLEVDWLEPAVELEADVGARLWPAALAWIVATEVARQR